MNIVEPRRYLAWPGMRDTRIALFERMNAEERPIHEHFGAEYDAHRSRTWWLITGVY
jgi:protein-S-isoprenylcysteine O-methyltransferase Ste14